MAENHKPSESIEEKTSFGAYIGKWLYTAVVELGGLIGGGVAGFAVGKALFPNSEPILHIKPDALEGIAQAMANEKNAKTANEWAAIFDKVPGLRKIPSIKAVWGMGIGAFAGSIVGTLILGYGHWKEGKQAQIQVNEIMKDISDIEIFKKTDPELKAENQRLWAELNKREAQKSTHVERARISKSEFKTHAEALKEQLVDAISTEGQARA
jgi:hypothetical protein